MPKENDDREPGSQQGLQPAAPLRPNGQPDGTEAPLPPSGPPEPNDGQPGPPVAEPRAPASPAPWLRPTDGPAIRTELQDANICKSCNTAIPIGAKACPKCHCFAPGHPGRRPRKGDVEKILASLLAEYTPKTTVLKETCEHLARAYGELKTMPAGSLEWQRILNITQELSVSLEASRAAHTPTDIDDDLTTDQLIERTTGILRGLLDLQDAENAPQTPESMMAAASALGDEYQREHGLAGPSVQAEADPRGARPEPTLASAPEPTCPYCRRPCIGPDHHAYDVFHYDDPTEVEKRRVKASAEMFARLFQPSRWD
jgi:ribosomal protein L40E